MHKTFHLKFVLFPSFYFMLKNMHKVCFVGTKLDLNIDLKSLINKFCRISSQFFCFSFWKRYFFNVLVTNKDKLIWTKIALLRSMFAMKTDNKHNSLEQFLSTISPSFHRCQCRNWIIYTWSSHKERWLVKPVNLVLQIVDKLP